MALITARFSSKTLLKQVEAQVVLPDQAGTFPVLYLLHGSGDDSSHWLRWSHIEREVRGLPLIVVMPDGFLGFSVDSHNGPAYATYFIEDVIGFVERSFPVVRKRSGRCIGGLSMGGYGALHLAMSHPDMFVSAHSHSGVFGLWGEHLATWGALEPAWHTLLHNLHGPRQEGSDLDLFALAGRLKGSGKRLPKLWIDCGLDDPLLADNRRFHDHLGKLGVKHAYEEYPGGHTWDYWTEHIGQALAFHCRALGLPGRG